MSDIVNGARLQFGPDMVLPTGQTLIKAFEDCRLTAYPDSGGKWTIGWGHTGPEVHAGLTWTQAQADQQFESDFLARCSALDKILPTSLKPGQLAAIQSLCYNSGVHAIETSHLLICVKGMDWIGAAHEFSRWDHVGPGENKGLLHRRLAEALIFISASR